MAPGDTTVGFTPTTSSGIWVDLSGSYDGIGMSGYDAVTGKATVRMPLN
jgi:hypothetical protein